MNIERSMRIGEDDQMDRAGRGSPEIYGMPATGERAPEQIARAATELVTIPGCGYAAEASMTDDGQYLYFGCGDLTTGRVKIMYSVKQPD